MFAFAIAAVACDISREGRGRLFFAGGLQLRRGDVIPNK